MTWEKRTEELDEFKTQINLCQYAASRGFELDRRQSSRASAVMRSSNGDKLIVARSNNRHWIYFNVHDARDRGTIVDFIQSRDRTSLGEVRKELRPWLGRNEAIPTTSTGTFPDLAPVEHDVAGVLGVWLQAEPVIGAHPYLENARKLPSTVLADPIFDDRIRMDARQNALFPHFGAEGLCGFEVKNQGFTGFSPGGVKGLWCSRPRRDDRQLVICETAIDALSYAALFGCEEKRLVSTAGQISPVQAKLLQLAATKLPDGGQIVLAMDNDAAGRQLAETIAETLLEAKIDSQAIRRHLPDAEKEDWNDVLRRTYKGLPSSPALG